MSNWVWAVPLVACFVGLAVWSIRYSDRVVADLTTRPEKEFQVAGIDRVRALQSQSVWGISPWRMRTIRRRLDQAAVNIAAFEQGQRGRDKPPWHP